MANKPFEYRIINPLERPKSEDLNIAQGQSHYDVRQFAYEIFGHQDGFLGSSFEPIPTDPTPDNNVVLTAGIAFQYGNIETAIGGIIGLNDSYQPKAVNIDTYPVAVTPAPGLPGEKRYDLIQIRAPADSERLVDSVATDIYNPSLNSFSSLTKSKTLTTSLSEFLPQYIVADGTATAPLSYVEGNAADYAFWNLVPKPVPTAGYMPVAYIRREYAQTEIAASDIEDARTLLKLPAMVGGTNATEIAPAGYVAYSDGAKLEFTQAIGGLYDSPQSGWLLASTAGGVPSWIEPAVTSSLLVSGGANTNPTWIAPGAAGQVLISTGTAWEASDLPGGGTSYLTSGTYTISAVANFVEITCIGGGGGGGGGARSDSGGEEGCGGGGGGGGGITRILYSAANLRTLGTELTITVGTGGLGGAGASVPDTQGNAGTAGTVSLVQIGTSQLARATGGAAGIGGKASNVQTAAGGDGGLGTLESGTTGGTGTSDTTQADSASSNIGAATGGGAGGGYDNPYPLSGGTSGSSGLFTRYLDGASGGVTGSPGSAGTSTSFGIAGTGGGGGGADAGLSGGAGGAGGAGGGGGGGGGYCRMTTAAAGSGGDGGDGGNGRVIIREW